MLQNALYEFPPKHLTNKASEAHWVDIARGNETLTSKAGKVTVSWVPLQVSVRDLCPPHRLSFPGPPTHTAGGTTACGRVSGILPLHLGLDKNQGGPGYHHSDQLQASCQ